MSGQPARQKPWAMAKGKAASCHAPKQVRGRNFGQRRKLAPRLAMHQSRRVAGTLGNGESWHRVLSCTKASTRRRVWLTPKIDAAPGVYQSNGAVGTLGNGESWHRVLPCIKAGALQELWAMAKGKAASCHAPKQARGGESG